MRQELDRQTVIIANKAVSLLDAGEPKRAERLIVPLRENHPKQPELATIHGNVLKALGRYSEAAKAYQIALESGMDQEEIRLAQAFCFSEAGQPENAFQNLDEIINGSSPSYDAYLMKARLKIKSGERGAAKESLLKAMDVYPDSGELAFELSQIADKSNKEKLIEILDKQVSNIDRPKLDKSLSFYALGKVYLNSGDVQKAFVNYSKANVVAGTLYDDLKAQSLEQKFQVVCDIFPKELFGYIAADANTPSNRVVISGLQSTGKSLLEKQLSRYKNVVAEGDSTKLSKFVATLLEPYQNSMSSWRADQSPESIQSLADTFHSQINDGKIHVTTEATDIWLLGFLGLISPNTPIIVCLRGLLDLAATNYFRTFYDLKSGIYNHDLYKIGRKIAIYERLLQHWANVLPNPIHIVEYEQLIENPEREVEKIAHALGLGKKKSKEHKKPLIVQEVQGLGEQFKDYLQPAVEGYKEVASLELTRLQEQPKSEAIQGPSTRGKILHVCLNDKFIPPFIKLIEEEFDFNEHVFWISGDLEKYGAIASSPNIFKCKGGNGNPSELQLLAKLMLEARKVILHGLFNFSVVLLLNKIPQVLPRCYWVIWGGDLYRYKLKRNDPNWETYEKHRRSVIRNMGYLINYNQGDIDLARKWYGATGQHLKCFLYLSNVYSDHKVIKKEQKMIKLLVGNSADPSNNHFEVFNMLSKYKDEDIQVIAPLSYGDEGYAREVMARGRAIFGGKFTALTQFIPYEEYLNILSGVDIAVFAHRRQQAMGNIRTLLGMGKKVYIRQDISSAEVFSKDGIKVFDILNFDLNPDFPERSENIKRIKSVYSKENLIKQWEDIFNA